MADAAHSWHTTRVALRDELLDVVSAQLHAGRSAKLVAGRLHRVLRVLRAVERQRELEPEDDTEFQDDLVGLVRAHVEAFRALTNHSRAAPLHSLAVTRRWLTSYIARFREAHHVKGGPSTATPQEWRALLEPVWGQALAQSTPLEEATIDEVRDARTANAAVLKFLCAARPEGPADDDLGRILDRVNLNPYT